MADVKVWKNNHADQWPILIWGDKDPSKDDGNEVNLTNTFVGFGLNLLFPCQNQNWGKLTIADFPQE